MRRGEIISPPDIRLIPQWVCIFLLAAPGVFASRPAFGAENCKELLPRAQQLLAQHQPEEALALLRRATQLCPSSAQIYDLLGIAYDLQNRPAEAQEAHLKAVALASTWPGYHNNLAISYARAGKTAEAQSEFQTALRFDPHNVTANANLADFCLKGKQYRQALVYLRNGHADRSSDPLLVYALAQAYFGVGETKLGLLTVARLSELVPADEKMRFAQALLLAENHQYSEAVKQFEAIPAPDRDFAVYQNLGLAYSRLRQHTLAQSAFQQALRIEPTNPEPYLGIGLDLLDARSFDQAVYTLTQAHQMAPQRLDIACGLAEALIQSGNLMRARDLLDDLKAKFPPNAALMQGLGDLYAAQGEDSKAVEEYRQALRSDPASVPARISLAKAEMRLREIPQAKNMFEEVLKIDPTNADSHAGLGRIALHAGEEDLALQELSQALREDPEELDAIEDSATIKVHKGEFKEARTLLETLVRLDPNTGRYHYLLARVLLKLGEASEAQLEFARSEAIGKSTHKLPAEP